MKAKLKLFFRRLTLRLLRKLVDLVDDRLHRAEVRLRNDLSDQRDGQHPSRTVLTREDMLHQRRDERPGSETFMQWEARRSGVAVISKKAARRRRALSAAGFDLRFAR